MSSPSQHQFVIVIPPKLKPTHTHTHKCPILYALTHIFTHVKALHTPFCSFSGDLSVSQARHRVHSCWYISTMHVRKAPSLSLFFSLLFFALISYFPIFQSFDKNSYQKKEKKLHILR